MAKTVAFEHVSCDFCGEEKYKLRYRKPDNWLWKNQFEFPVVECVKCGLVYVNPRPTKESMKEYYPNDYHDNRNTQLHFKRYSIQSGFLPRLRYDKVLDIGCAKGDFLHFLINLYPNIDAYGVDLYSDGVNYNNINFMNKELTNCCFEENEFDIITAWAVFEHLHCPDLYFAQVSRILKQRGKFIYLVTNAESLYGRRAYAEDIPRHLYHFSEKSLSNYALKHGLKILRTTYDDRLWDGRGMGTCYYYLQRLFGVSWEKRFFRKISSFQKKIGVIGNMVDRNVFKGHWEARRKRSGIIIVECIKK